MFQIHPTQHCADTSKAAQEHAIAAAEILPADAGVLQLYAARFNATAHYIRYTAPYPAILRNLSRFTVEEIANIARRTYKYVRRQQAKKLLEAPTATKEDRDFALRELDLYDNERGVTFAQELVDSLIRNSAAVVVETVAGGVGTFILPGVGTWLFEFIGGLLCQI